MHDQKCKLLHKVLYKLATSSFINSGYLPQHTSQPTTHQPPYHQQMHAHPGYRPGPNTSQYPPRQSYSNYPPPTQLPPDGSSRPADTRPSQYPGLAGQTQVEGHHHQGNRVTAVCLGRLIKCTHYKSCRKENWLSL